MRAEDKPAPFQAGEVPTDAGGRGADLFYKLLDRDVTGAQKGFHDSVAADIYFRAHGFIGECSGSARNMVTSVDRMRCKSIHIRSIYNILSPVPRSQPGGIEDQRGLQKLSISRISAHLNEHFCFILVS